LRSDKLESLRVKAIAFLFCRALVIAGCVFSVWRALHIAAADWVARSGSVDSLVKAMRYTPDDPRLLARLAMARNDNGDQTPAVDDQLRRAALLDPYDSNLLMTLGLREEFAGNHAAAERDLTRAAEIDHQFKPAWTLANFYDRAGEPARALPMIQRILALDLLEFDLRPLFALSWRVVGDRPAAVFSLIPKKAPLPVRYLEFLVETRRTDAALQAWPAALAAGDPHVSRDAGTFTGFTDFLANAGRLGDAVSVWNQLVDRNVIHAGRLDPAKGVSVADPGFRFPAAAGAFAWQMADIPGVATGAFNGYLRLEISGDEPESFRILSLLAPIMPARRYRLAWETDASALSDPKDPGLSFRISQGDVVKECPPLLTSPRCEFTSAAGSPVSAASLSLGYKRAPGTTRVSGTLHLSGVRLDLLP
jgi:tetratricopeptide (TPR) repeat protein